VKAGSFNSGTPLLTKLVTNLPGPARPSPAPNPFTIVGGKVKA
jgi:hypothetical protein